MTTKMILTLIAAGMTFNLAATQPLQAANNNTGIYIWYVKRTATHLGSGGTQVHTYGPYYTYDAAVSKKQQLDQSRFYGTFYYGVAYIEQKVNPAVYSRPYSLSPYQQLELYLLDRN